MENAKDKLMRCYESFRKQVSFKPDIAIILGSGLGALADEINVEAVLDYSDITDFPQSTVAGHKGRFVFGHMDGVKVVIMQGRVHYYEGYPITDVVLPVRLMKLMGAKALFLTNAAGSVNTSYNAGDFMLIKDQIANFVPCPLIGPNIEELGPRFPDMSDIYDKELRTIIKSTAGQLGIELREGVYIQLTGPNYESPAEIRMCRAMGADAVGMSTACEAIAANHAGMKICGISCIVNLGCGIKDTPLSHTEVMEAADKSAPFFKKLVTESVKNISKTL